MTIRMEKLTRVTWDYIPKIARNMNPGRRCTLVLTLLIAIRIYDANLRKMLVLTTQINEATLRGSVVVLIIFYDLDKKLCTI